MHKNAFKFKIKLTCFGERNDGKCVAFLPKISDVLLALMVIFKVVFQHLNITGTFFLLWLRGFKYVLGFADLSKATSHEGIPSQLNTV